MTIQIALHAMLANTVYPARTASFARLESTQTLRSKSVKFAMPERIAMYQHHFVQYVQPVNTMRTWPLKANIMYFVKIVQTGNILKMTQEMLPSMTIRQIVRGAL